MILKQQKNMIQKLRIDNRRQFKLLIMVFNPHQVNEKNEKPPFKIYIHLLLD